MKRKIVIVEDDRLLAIVLKKMAVSLNYEVLDVTKTGREAIESIRQNKPDLIFMDIFLADDTTGIEAMRQIRKHSGVPVLYITANSDLEVRREASEIDNSFFMTKPINMQQLRTAVQGISTAA